MMEGMSNMSDESIFGEMVHACVDSVTQGTCQLRFQSLQFQG
jgi:hypothetical protein